MFRSNSCKARHYAFHAAFSCSLCLMGSEYSVQDNNHVLVCVYLQRALAPFHHSLDTLNTVLLRCWGYEAGEPMLIIISPRDTFTV